MEQMQELEGLLAVRSDGFDRSNSRKMKLCSLVASSNKSASTKRKWWQGVEVTVGNFLALVTL
jgi:hypothetical protein